MGHVIVRLMGGLGNQLFQYAAGTALAQRLGVPLLLDRGFLDHRPADMTWTPRAFELDVFDLPIAFATEAQVRYLRRPMDRRGYSKAHAVLPSLFPDHVFRDKGHGFDPAVKELKAPVYMEGYWQNEGYFLSIADSLRTKLYVPRELPSTRNSEALATIKSTKSASIHVRRGDYVSDAETSRFHGVCSVDYHTSGAELLATQHGVQHFFIFSDDPVWVKENIRLPYPTTHVSHNTGSDGHWDLWLMKQCDHHIIANSSFSWWGAWLNTSPTKQVIGPARWFQGRDLPSSAILPPTWLVR